MKYSFNKLGQDIASKSFAAVKKSNKSKVNIKPKLGVGFAEEKPRSISIQKFHYELTTDYDEKELSEKLDLNGEARHLNIALKDNNLNVEVSKDANVLGLKMKIRSVLDECGLNYVEVDDGTESITESEAVNSVYLRDVDKIKEFINYCKNWGSTWFNSKSKIKKDAAQQISGLITSLSELIK